MKPLSHILLLFFPACLSFLRPVKVKGISH
jgi:hypothetical protein